MSTFFAVRRRTYDRIVPELRGVPALAEGEALVVTRYDEEKAVVMSPRDFRRLAALDAALEAIQAAEALMLTPLVLEAHRLEDEPDEPVEDPAAIRKLLGL